MADSVFNPPNRSTEDPNSIFDLFGNIRSRNQSYPDPNASWSMQPVGGNHNIAVVSESKQAQAPPTSSGSKMADGWADLSSILGSFSQGKKADRVVQGNYTQNYDQMMLNREGAINSLMSGRDLDMNKLKLLAQEDRRANEEDALHKLQQTSYIAGGGSDFKPATISLGGKQVTLPSFAGIAPHAPSEADKAGALTLQAQMLDRLKPEGSFTPKYDFNPTFDYKVHPLEDYTKPGKLENLGSYGGTISGVLGGLDQMGGGGIISKALSHVPGLGKLFGAAAGTGGTGMVMNAAGVPVVESSIGGGVGAAPGAAGGLMSGMLGKALPIAGIAAGGYGLLKDRGLGHNMMNGAQAGAGVGSLVMPGIGTAVGAGIGALAGGLRGIGGGPNDAEKAGRTVSAQGVQAIGSTATPAQKAEAGNNPDALAHVIMRDALVRAGNPNAEALAGQYLASIKAAEKKGPDAVQQVLASLSKNFG